MTEARQGHKYRLDGHDVLALSSGPRPRVAYIVADRVWPLGESLEVDAERLEPMPMKYFHGQVPK